MAKIGRFRNEAARAAYLRAYDDMAGLWPLPAEMQDVPTRFGNTRVTSSGSGPGLPLVAMHGLNGTGLSWYGCVSQLSEGRAVHAPDTIGVAGRSEQTAPLASDADLGLWFCDVLDGLGLGRVHLLGESQGAWHATLATLNAPDRVASLSVIEPNGFVTRTPRRALVKFVRLAARPTDKGWKALGDWLTPGVVPSPEEIALAKAAARFRPGVGWARLLRDAELRSITAPLLAIFGADSVLIDTHAAAERLTRLVPHAQTTVIPGGGHGVRAQFPDRVLGQVTDFARAHESLTR